MWRTLEEELVSQEESLVQLWEDLRCKYQKFWWSLHHEHEIDVKEAVKESISWIYQDLMMRDMVKGYKECFWAAGTVLITQGIGKELGLKVLTARWSFEAWSVGVSTAFQVQVSRLSWLDRRLVESGLIQGGNKYVSGFCKRFSVVFLILISGAFEVNQMGLQRNQVAGSQQFVWTEIEQRFSTSKVFLTGLCWAACSVGDSSGAGWCSSQCVHQVVVRKISG